VIVARSLALAGLVALLPGCYASNVVAPEARAVQVEAPRRVWRPAAAADVPGFYESTEVGGASAGAVLRAYMWLGAGGEYSAAALVVGEDHPRFAVLADDGRWSFGPAGLDLHDGTPPVQLFAADGALRLVTADATMVFRRVSVE
jgi:hypothetical protein